MPSCKAKKHSNRIVINVGGVRHETFLSTLKNIPDTRLYNLGDHHTTVAKSPEYDKSTGEYFFDRHPGVFAHILNFYRTGRLHCPADVCGPLFEEELGFWSIDEQQVETCCWESYKQHKEKQEKLKYFKLPGYDDELEDRYLSKDSGLFEDVDDVQSWWSRYQPKVWKSLEEPHTSLWAKFVGMVSFLMFTAYLIKFSLTTLDYFSDRTAPRYIALSVIHLICLSWFTMDFALRLVFSPDKRAFVKSPFTWTDLIPLVLLYVFFFFPSLEKVPFLEMLVMLKAARIFQLFKLSYVLQVLVNTLKASSSELCLLLGIMAFVMVVFASIMYFLERHEFESDFKSVPESMWWAVITMTTVGYGEVYPRTWIGKTVGSACAICGVLVIALPVSVVASNFSLFYTYAKARLNVPPKKRRVALSHALTSMHNARTQGGEAQSLKFASLGSDRATPDRSLQASEISISCTMTPRGSLKKSSFWSLRSFSKLLRPQRRSYMSHSQSLNSILSEIKHNKQQESIEGITLKLEPPSRAPSAIDLPKFQGSLPTGDNPFLHVPEHKKTCSVKGSIKEPCGLPLLNKSLYPLHLRRGAVSPASFSLKSNSTASSLNALPRGYNELCNALSGKGPIILLSDQASVNSFCSLQSLNPRMACSCSSLGDTTATNDGSSVSSIPMAAAKADGKQITLSVPVERHGQRKQSKENKTEETKEKDCDYNLLATDNEKRRSETDDGIKQNEEFAPPVELFKIMDDESPTLYNSELSLSDQEMADGIDSVFTHEESAGNLPAQFLSSALGSRQQESNIIRMNQNNSNGFCRDGSDGSPDGESAAVKESPLPKFRSSEENQFSDKDNNVTLLVNPSATTCLVRPSPSFGKISLMSCLESDLSNDMLPLNGEINDKGGLGTQNRTAPLAMTNNSNKENNVAPKRRNSAFTFCRKDSSSKSPRKGSVPLSAGYMRELTAECEPLWNGHVARARPCDETVETQMDLHSNSCQGDYESRLRKSGLLSSTDSPTNSTQDIHEPLDENKRFRSNCTNRDEHENIDIQDEVDWLRPISPLSSQREPLYNSTADGFRPILSVEYEQCSKKDRTTRV